MNRFTSCRERAAYPPCRPGSSLGDDLTWNRTFGEQAGTRPIFNIGSISKPIIAAAVMQLVEQGLVDLVSDATEYLPFELRNPHAPATPITVRMLLTHQSGLSHFTARHASYTTGQPLLDWVQAQYGRTIYGEISTLDPRPELGEFLAAYLVEGGDLFADDVWTGRPGQYAYSTTGYDVLGLIVSRVSGMPLENYLDQYVYRPLGMTSNGLPLDEASGRRAIPCDLESSITFSARVEMSPYDRRILGGGGITSTVPDLSRFVIAQLNGGRGEEASILMPESVAAMQTMRVASTADIGMAGYGYGLNTMRAAPSEYYGHSYDFHGSLGHGGKDYGYMSRLFFVPVAGSGYGAILLANRSDFLDSDMI